MKVQETLTLQLSTSQLKKMAFDILILPPELRNHIYKAILESDTALVGRRGILFSTCSISKICKQVRREYNDMLYLSTGNFTARVREFDCRHVVTFLNKRSKSLQTSTPTLPVTTKLQIELYLPNPGCHINTNVSGLFWKCDQLERWLKRCGRETPSAVEVQYWISKDTILEALKQWHCRINVPFYNTANHRAGARNEMRKIQKAVYEGFREVMKVRGWGEDQMKEEIVWAMRWQ